MSASTKNVLFLCTGNSARSIMAEALLNRLGKEHFRAFSAGSHPAGQVQPMASELARSAGYEGELRSKSWDEFAQAGAPRMDIVITVCDDAAGEVCPVWPGQPITAHWGVADPAAVAGDEQTRRRAYLQAWALLRRRVELLLSLPLDKLDRLASTKAIKSIGSRGDQG